MSAFLLAATVLLWADPRAQRSESLAHRIERYG